MRHAVLNGGSTNLLKKDANITARQSDLDSVCLAELAEACWRHRHDMASIRERWRIFSFLLLFQLIESVSPASSFASNLVGTFRVSVAILIDL